MNNWQSIDFRESMNALLSQKLLGYDNDYQLPTVIWQDNSAAQSWTDLETFGGQTESQFPLGQDRRKSKIITTKKPLKSIANHILHSTKISLGTKPTK